MHIIFWFENLKGVDYFEDLGIDQKIILLTYLLTYLLHGAGYYLKS
jgi:hypothetical protein